MMSIPAFNGCSFGGGDDAPASNNGPQESISCMTSSGNAPTNIPVNASNLSALSGTNVVPVTFGAGSGLSQNVNIPYVSISLCNSAGGDCETINNILLDTGSFGLRVFKQALTSKLASDFYGTNPTTAECVQFGDGSSEWGPVVSAMLTIGSGGMTTTPVPIQIVDSTFGRIASGSSACGDSPDTEPVAFNGILGVGLFIHDCGDGTGEGLLCAEGSTLPNPNPGGGSYYQCSAGQCANHDLAQASQVQNPIAFLPAPYSNGFVLELPDVGNGGDSSSSAMGYAIFGIGTFANNTPANGAVSVYSTDASGSFQTTFSGQGLTSFLDTGSNGLFFPNVIVGFPLDSNSWAIPSGAQNCSAVNAGGSSQSYVPFQISNFDQLVSGNNIYFNDVGGDLGDIDLFDWGLPFFIGRNVYIGLDGKSATINGQSQAGPYWAY